ncbi:MAG: hydantoinase/oxoprolinase family protein, partial [Gammaproteobacteria bacterium]|nr:hydantoinase/oxoprolinase family protein [Gammaproteobacteria bacterium]
DAETFQQLFEQDYIALFGRAVEGMDIEITVWSVNSTTLAEPAEPVETLSGAVKTLSNDQRSIFDPALGTVVDSSIVLRSGLEPGDLVSGPAAITEDETTIILPSSRQAVRQSDGCIDVVQQA